MADDQLDLDVGETLQLQKVGDDVATRYLVRLIGYLPGGSLLVTPPTVNGKIVLVRESQPFAVRMLHGSHVRGFMTRVLHNAAKPFPHLHLEYPKEIESLALRNAERVSVVVPARARNTRRSDAPEHWHPVEIRDLSISGCRIESTLPIAQQGDSLELRFVLQVCGEQEEIRLIASCKNRSTRTETTEQGEEIRYGLGSAFLMINRYQKLLLSNYVLEHRG